VRRLLVAILLCAVGTAVAPGAAAAFKRAHHADPAKVFKKHKWPRKARMALDGNFQTTWPCTTHPAADLAPVRNANAPQIKVLYARASDGADNFATFAGLAQSDAKALRDRVATDSDNTKSIRFDTGATGGATCDANPQRYLDIQKVQLPNTKAHYNTAGQTFRRVTDDLKALLPAPANGARANYVVYLDDIAAGGASGEADIPLDDRDSPLNGANQGRDGNGRLFALIYETTPAQNDGPRRATVLHELSHNLGAVQNSAPHSTNAGHCFDERDIMCYDDDNVPSTFPLTTLCAVGTEFDFSELYDCNGDDYFNDSPAAGSYLAQNWNSYDSVYLCAVDACDTALTPPSGVAIATAHPGGKLSLTASADQPIASYEWDIDGDGVFDHETGSTAAVTPAWDSDDARTVTVRASKADGTFGIAQTTVTPTRPSPSFDVTGRFAVGETLLLDGTSTEDPDGQITKFLWDLDGDGTFETDTGLTRTASTSFAAPGEVSLGLEIDYPFGTSWTRTAPFAIAPASAPAPTPTSPVGTNPPVTSVAAPVLTATRVKLAKLLKAGLPLSVKCAAACSLSFTLSVDARTAKKLKLKGKRGKPVVIGRLSARLGAGTSKRTLRLTATAKRTLRRAKTLKAKLTGSVTQVPGTPLRVARTLTFKR
jgi:hypothetical protein